MHKTKKIIVFVSILILLFSLESILLNFTVDFEPEVFAREKQVDSINSEEEKPAKPPTLEMKKGIVFKIFFLNSLLQEVNDDYTPNDGRLEKTIEKIESLLIGYKIGLVVNLFIIALCLSTIVSVLNDTWFSVFIGRVLLSISFFTFIYYVARSLVLGYFVPFIGIPLFVFHFTVFNLVTMAIIHSFQRFFDSFFSKRNVFYFVLTLFAVGFCLGLFLEFRSATSLTFIPPVISGISSLVYGLFLTGYFWLVYRLNRYLKLTETSPSRFNALLLASYNDEENNARPAIKGIGVEVKKESSFLKIASHFLYIIFAGVFIGNVVYIPLFSLQKHYSSEFGVLLFVMLILLSIFYVRNYYKIGREEDISTSRNVLVSLSFLQYRFIKNLLFILLSTIGVIVFITCLFLLLTMNTVILKNQNIIDKTINL